MTRSIFCSSSRWLTSPLEAATASQIAPALSSKLATRCSDGGEDLVLLIRKGLAEGGADLDEEIACDGEPLLDAARQTVAGRRDGRVPLAQQAIERVRGTVEDGPDLRGMSVENLFQAFGRAAEIAATGLEQHRKAVPASFKCSRTAVARSSNTSTKRVLASVKSCCRSASKRSKVPPLSATNSRVDPR